MISFAKLTQKLCHKDKDMIIGKIRNSGYKKACETARNVCDFARCAHPQYDRHPSLSGRKHHAKGGFIAWLRRSGDGSTMQGYYLLADTQPDARTTRLGCKERHKNTLHHLRKDSLTIISNRNDEIALVARKMSGKTDIRESLHSPLLPAHSS